MTRLGGSDTVHLSLKDWFGIVAIVVTLLTAILSVYLHHDRQLTSMIVRQEMIIDRIDRIESNIDRRLP